MARGWPGSSIELTCRTTCRLCGALPVRSTSWPRTRARRSGGGARNWSRWRRGGAECWRPGEGVRAGSCRWEVTGPPQVEWLRAKMTITQRACRSARYCMGAEGGTMRAHGVSRMSRTADPERAIDYRAADACVDHGLRRDDSSIGTGRSKSRQLERVMGIEPTTFSFGNRFRSHVAGFGQ